MRYVILIYDENSANPPAEAPPPEVWDQVMGDYNAYTAMLRERGAYLAAEALQPVQTATSVRGMPSSSTSLSISPATQRASSCSS